MVAGLWPWVAGVSAVAAALAGGTTYAFSSFVMRGLGALRPGDAVRAMQAINVAAISPVFLGLFMGTGLVSAGVAVASLWAEPCPARSAYLAGAVVYAVGPVGVTLVGNVPLNDALARVDGVAAGVAGWAAYAAPWLRLNHLRTAAAAVAAGCFVAAAVLG